MRGWSSGRLELGKQSHQPLQPKILKWHVCECMFGRVWLLVIPWAVTHLASLSMGLSRQESWSGLPFPSPGDISWPRTEPVSPALAGRVIDSGFYDIFPTGSCVFWQAAHGQGLSSSTQGLFTYNPGQNKCSWHSKAWQRWFKTYQKENGKIFKNINFR